MIAALLPYLIGGGVALAAAIAAIFSHLSATAKVAVADKKVADAQAAVAQAQTTVAQANDAAAQANAKAAQAGAESLKEKVNVTNDVAAMPAGAVADELRDDWSK
jgi:predicted homoserine dehydrogenase-like protein